MYEDSFLEMEYEDRFYTDFEPDDLEMFNQAEADDYRHDFDDDYDVDEGDFGEWESQFDERCSWDEVD